MFEHSEISRQTLLNHIEALIFVAENPIKPIEILKTLKNALDIQVSEELLEQCIEQIKGKFNKAESAIELVDIGKGYLLITKTDYHKSVTSFLNLKAKKRLSKSAMETLAIIAYKQPVTKSDIEQIRGVSADYSIQKLLEKELIETAGRAETIGKPLLYKTSDMFMQHFGLNTMKDLPKYSEIMPQVNRIEKDMLEQQEANNTDTPNKV